MELLPYTRWTFLWHATSFIGIDLDIRPSGPNTCTGLGFPICGGSMQRKNALVDAGIAELHSD